jgi:hypothetical protein
MSLYIPVPRAETGGLCQSKENCHFESENFLKFLLTRANFSKFNFKPFRETSPGDFGTEI